MWIIHCVVTALTCILGLRGVAQVGGSPAQFKVGAEIDTAPSQVLGLGRRTIPLVLHRRGSKDLRNLSPRSPGLTPCGTSITSGTNIMTRHKLNDHLEILITGYRSIEDTASLRSLMQTAVDKVESNISSQGATTYLPPLGIDYTNDVLKYVITPHGDTAFTWGDVLTLTNWLQQFEVDQGTAIYLDYNVIYEATTYKKHVAYGRIVMADPSGTTDEELDDDCNPPLISTIANSTS